MADETRWYSLRVISGKEKKIRERLIADILRSGWADIVPQIIVPSEKVYKIRNSKKVIMERNILPGYLLVEAYPSKFSGEIVQHLSNMPDVIHFLGKNNPIPMTQVEANRMIGKVDDYRDARGPMIERFKAG